MLNVDWLINLHFFKLCFINQGHQITQRNIVLSIFLIIIFNNTQTKSKYLKSKKFNNITLYYFLIKISITYYYLLLT